MSRMTSEEFREWIKARTLAAKVAAGEKTLDVARAELLFMFKTKVADDAFEMAILEGLAA